MDDQYYIEEINYLLDEGKEFARQHPQKARMLHLDDIRSRDPNVERLIESFAFLTSRIRKRLDDDFTKIADGLFSLIWPGYLNPIPSFCLMECRPNMRDLTGPLVVPKDTQVDSEPVGNDSVKCRFRTCFASTVIPAEITGTSVEPTGSTCTVKLSFSFSDSIDPTSLRGHRARVQFLGEFSLCWQLYNLLLGKNGRLANVDHLVLTAKNQEGQTVSTWTLGPQAISPAGLTKDEALLPTTQTVLWSFGLLRDFFSFTEKFQAFDLDIFDHLADLADVGTLDLQVHINSPWPSNLRIDKSNFRLNTVPIVNLFDQDADPVRLDRTRHKYTVRGDLRHPEHYQVYSVDSVHGIEIGSGQRKIYLPLYTSRSSSNTIVDERLFYCLTKEKSSWGGLETFISFVEADDDVEFPAEEVISLSITCTNGRLPSQLIPEQINLPVSDVLDGLEPRNISHPTPFVLPDTDKDPMWRWLSHASLNFMNLGSVDQFKSMLRLHDFSNSDANLHKIEGIQAMALSSTKRLYKGALVPGIAVTLTLNEEHFSDPGEIQLFANVLSSFMTSYASINSYVQVSIKLEPSKQEIVIQPKMGENFPL